MPSPKGDRREQIRSTAEAEVQRWERLLTDELTTLWARQEAVVLVRLQGTKARKHTRHWTPTPSTEGKALNPLYIVDLARWVLQSVDVVSTLLRRLYEDVILTVFRQLGYLVDSGVFTPATPVEVPSPARNAAGVDADGLTNDVTVAAERAAAAAARQVAAAVDRRDVGPRSPAGEGEDGATVPADVIEAHVRSRIENIARGVTAAVEEVQVIIADADEKGAPLDEIADRVRATYQERSKVWTSKVVNANVIGAMNESALMAAAAAGVGKKQWLAAHDTRVRDSHREADGKVVALDEEFELDAGRVAYPGDPAGPAGEVINCRCTLLFPMPGLPAYDPGAFKKALPVYRRQVEQTEVS